MANMVSSFLDSTRSNRLGICKCVENESMKETFLHEIKYEYTFRIVKGKMWHPEMCIYCLAERYLENEGEHKLFKIPNIRGCLWILFKESIDALYFSYNLCWINSEELLIIKETPAKLCDLIKEIDQEDRWCSHAETL